MKIQRLFFAAVAGIFVFASGASAAPGKKICLDPDTGQIRVKRNCTGFTTQELSAQSIVLGQVVKLSADETGAIRSASDHIIGPVDHLSPGFYEVSTTISNLGLCSMTVSQNLKNDSSAFAESHLIVYPNQSDATKFRVEITTASGTFTDMAFSVLAHCPRGI